jgi:hypothetical protein
VVRAPGDDAKGKVPDVITGRVLPLTGPPCQVLMHPSMNR